MTLRKTIDSIIQSSLDNPKDVFRKLVKLQEEVGEASSAILRRNGLKSPSSKSIESLDENILEEICDILIVAISILPHYNYDVSDLENTLKTKILKWKTNIPRNQNWKKTIERRESRRKSKNGKRI